MAIKNLLVGYNGSEASSCALEAGILMQNKYDAYLTGLLIHESQTTSKSMQGWTPAHLQRFLSYAEERAIERIEKDFGYATRSVPQDKVQWMMERGRKEVTVAEFARFYDIVLLGQLEESGDTESVLHPERIAMVSGRPVLVVPKNWRPKFLAGTAILAWDGRRAATRALWDAMQIIETKSRVTIVPVKSKDILPSPEYINVETVLLRHGVESEHIYLKQKERSVDMEIVDYCNNENADLLIMGAYENSKFREDLFGGVTKDVLKEIKYPY